ncbi:ABC transporter permease [Solibacillus sp. MA9]|uniref:ABC transporter permease n=1 Tax=Solibacillus palustris TaxID=2908203 RepID=A0ABS9UI62_9BACL|nr:ABC transporter permease [Solibacillus sp. MA9]MCH7323835.1 ABC transporter permease [Solibacillus sp. MA9]
MNLDLLQKQFQSARRHQRQKILLLQLCLLIGLLLCWQLATQFRILDPLIFSSPQAVASLFITKISDGSLLPHVGITLFETVIGFLLGTLFGTVLAIFLWASKTAAAVLDPYLVVLNAMPKVAIGPMILVIFGPNMLAVIVMGVLISVIISTIVIFSAFLQVNENYVKVMQLFHASKYETFRHVVLPASMPTIISTLKVNVGLSWVGVIVGEFLVSSKGLGYLIISGFQVFNFTLVFLALVMILVIATVMYKLVELIERKILGK